MQTDLVAPIGINHLVINVRNMAELHRFWTEIVGLKQVGAVRPRGDRGPTRTMQFYSADHDGQMTHHDVALMEYPELPAPAADGTRPVPSATSPSLSRIARPGCTGSRICKARASGSSAASNMA